MHLFNLWFSDLHFNSNVCSQLTNKSNNNKVAHIDLLVTETIF